MRLVVVGGVAAGLSAASRARRIDPRMDITVLEKGERISYGACGLPYLIEGLVKSIDELVVYQPDVFERGRNIRIRTGAEVASIAHARREVRLAGGERVPYDKLVWAGGARPDRTAAQAPHVFCLHTDRDALALLEFLQTHRPRRAAVVGGGYIGLEMAGALRARGLQVSLYEAATTLLGRQDPLLSEQVQRHLERCRIAVHLNTRVPDAAQLDADVVVLSTGLKPNVEIPAEAGIELGRTGAIRTSERMETNLSGVFAAGDCAETTHLVTGRPAWIPLGTTANKMGRVAGACAAGRRERFPGVVGTSIVRVAGLAVGCTGLSAVQAKREGFQPVSALVEKRERPKYFRGARLRVELVADKSTRRLLGATVVGEEGVLARLNPLAAALAARMPAEDLVNLDLAYAPPYATAMDPLLVAAQQLMKLLD